MIQEQLRELLAGAVGELRRDGVIPDEVTAAIEVERPARPNHGDFSTNLALTLSGKLQTPPRALADRIIQALPEADWVEKVTVAGPGFINFFLTHAWLQDTLRDIASQRELYGRSQEGEAPLPEDGYQGGYLTELGAELAADRGDRLVGRLDEIRAWGLERMLGGIGATLERFGVRFDNWFSEQSLHDTGKLATALDRLRQTGLTFEEDGALWFRSTEVGDSRDRVLVRSDGRPTYLTSDVAYLIDKAERGFDHAVYVWGADHHGAVASLEAAGRALELPIVVEILLYQLVNLYSGGEVVRMSKRTGEIVTLDELIDEVGADAARFTFLLRSLDGALDFDLDLVKAKSQENPVYYVQYAHARICSILRLGAEQGVALGPIEEAPLSLLVHETEQALARMLSEYPETLAVAARLRAPHRLTTYTRELAALFHAFYRDCRVISDDPQLTQARLWLAEATRQVLANALAVLGVAAPEKM